MIKWKKACSLAELDDLSSIVNSYVYRDSTCGDDINPETRINRKLSNPLRYRFMPVSEFQEVVGVPSAKYRQRHHPPNYSLIEYLCEDPEGKKIDLSSAYGKKDVPLQIFNMRGYGEVVIVHESNLDSHHTEDTQGDSSLILSN